MKNDKYKERIIQALTQCGTYHEGMALLVDAAATTLRTIDLCRNEVSQLATTTVTVTTQWGERLEPHPVFKTLRDAQATFAKQCKLLGLTATDFQKIMDAENDPIEDLRRRIESITD